MITNYNSMTLEHTPVKFRNEKEYLTNQEQIMTYYLGDNEKELSPNEKAAVAKLNELAILLI